MGVLDMMAQEESVCIGACVGMVLLLVTGCAFGLGWGRYVAPLLAQWLWRKEAEAKFRRDTSATDLCDVMREQVTGWASLQGAFGQRPRVMVLVERGEDRLPAEHCCAWDGYVLNDTLTITITVNGGARNRDLRPGHEVHVQVADDSRRQEEVKA